MESNSKKIQEPWNFFDHPDDIAGSKSLSNRQKVEMLQSWLYEIEHRLDSANEGMPPHGQTDTDMKLLENLRQNVEAASRALKSNRG